MKIAFGPKRKWWYMLATALLLPSLLATLLYQVALLFPGTVKQVWFDHFVVAMLLTTPLLVLFVLTRAKSHPNLRILASVLAILFFLLIALSTRFSMPCGELPEYIGRDSAQNSSGECE